MSTNQILGFLEKYCTKVKHNEKSHYVDLMMDNHYCVEFNETQWYVPKTSVPNHEIIREHLIDNYLI
jgi:hypothetical protein